MRVTILISPDLRSTHFFKRIIDLKPINFDFLHLNRTRECRGLEVLQGHKDNPVILFEIGFSLLMLRLETGRRKLPPPPPQSRKRVGVSRWIIWIFKSPKSIYLSIYLQDSWPMRARDGGEGRSLRFKYIEICISLKYI